MLTTYGLSVLCANCGLALGFNSITTEDIDAWLRGFKAREITCENCQSKFVVARESLQVSRLPSASEP